MHRYWFLKLSSDMMLGESDDGVLPEAAWSIPEKLAAKLRAGHRIVLASWNEEQRIGRVRAFAICAHVAAQEARVQWRPAETVLRPLPPGMVHWQTKDHFRFADTVVDRYGLDDLFAEHFGEFAPIMERRPGSTLDCPAALPRASSRLRTAGHIYVLRSPHGYKIGKTISLRDRVRLFAVKLPFMTTLVHSFESDDYTASERALHQHFAGKRLEGEWFDLDAADLAYIKQQHPGSATR